MKKALTGIFVLGLVGIAWANFTGKIVDRPGQPVAYTQSIDVGDFDRISVQAIYSDGTPADTTFIDGGKSMTSITVTGYDTIGAVKASVTVNVATTTGLSTEYVVLNGVVYTAGTDFAVGTTSTTAAANLAGIISSHPDFAATSSGSTVTVTASGYGTAANSWPVSTSDASIMAVGAATFASGVAQHTININGTTLSETTDWTAATSNSATAKSISDAIVANATLASIIISTWSGDVVYATATTDGYNAYYVTVSTSALTVENGGFTGGSDGDVDTTNDTITETDHGYLTGLAVCLAVTAGTAPTGLTDGTTYYAIFDTDDTYQLATSTANAVAGTDIDITAITGGGTFGMNPSPLSAATQTGFKWQASNDNTNWTDIPTIATVSWSAAGNTIWDLGEFDYRYLRFNYVGPATGQGGLDIDVYLHGKR